MKTMKMLCALMVVLAIGVGAQAAVLYETGFETSDGFSDGTSIHGVDGWNVSDGSVIASSTNALAGGLSLEAKKSGGLGTANIDVTASSLLTAEFTALSVGGSNGSFFYLNGLNDNRGASLYTSDGWWKAWDGGAMVRIKGAAPDTAFDIKMVADASTQTYDVYIDGVLKADDFGFRETTTSTLERFKVLRTYSTAMVLDNLVISDVAPAPPVEITSQPESLLLDSGGVNIQFAITATNADTYQWYLDDAAISTSDSNFAGADSNTLTVYDVDQAQGDTGVYYCQASNANFSRDSDKVVLAIKGMVAHYKFDEGSGNTAADSSAYGNDANVVGASFVATGPVDGGSLSFAAGNECTLLSAAEDLPLLGLPYTIEAWINLDAAADNAITAQTVVSYGGSQFSFYITDYAGSNSSYEYDASTVRMAWPAGGTISAGVYADHIDVIGNWVHYATTFDGTDRVIYVNGQKISLNVPSAVYDTDNADDFKIGGGDTAGIIDDIKIYNYARTHTQIADAVYAVTGEPVCLEALGYGDKYEGGEDLNHDCKIDFADFADFAANWLDSNLYETP